MSRISQIKCDQCGTTTTHRAAADSGWQRTTAMSVFEGPLFSHSLSDFADLCSWRCVMSYSADKANAEWLAASATTPNAP